MFVSRAIAPRDAFVACNVVAPQRMQTKCDPIQTTNDERRNCGTVALWHRGAVALWLRGTVALWRCGNSNAAMGMYVGAAGTLRSHCVNERIQKLERFICHAIIAKIPAHFATTCVVWRVGFSVGARAIAVAGVLPHVLWLVLGVACLAALVVLFVTVC